MRKRHGLVWYRRLWLPLLASQSERTAICGSVALFVAGKGRVRIHPVVVSLCGCPCPMRTPRWRLSAIATFAECLTRMQLASISGRLTLRACFDLSVVRHLALLLKPLTPRDGEFNTRYAGRDSFRPINTPTPQEAHQGRTMRLSHCFHAVLPNRWVNRISSSGFIISTMKPRETALRHDPCDAIGTCRPLLPKKRRHLIVLD
ncbi:hypothetical protein LMG31506_01415 [Cupriavidus yeoncheonensis]|uniref:Uncharacterized protein n=1 Tax=Cupriavidus yeoncheonensis TaxID=1462994 RepID=A0A916IQ69_9BURK|nr:hypothetical protein LMG31506_01415 [Cupriavidus yeoncheonensis]